MSGISARLPLQYDSVDGPYGLTKTYEEVVKQNFKMLLLTNPGEKIMDQNYGVGIYNLLFEQVGQNSFAGIRARIEQQASFYMPFIRIIDISFESAQDSMDILENEVNIKIKYEILPLKRNDVLQIVI
jgi:phage baseplate assembly protein W